MKSTVKEAQKFCGFMSSIKSFSPLQLARYHAILSPLTSSNHCVKKVKKGDLPLGGREKTQQGVRV